MDRSGSSRRIVQLGLFGLVAQLFGAGSARAICDVIPQPQTAFRGATAAVNRVYLADGDTLVVSRDASDCDAASPAFNATAANNVVTYLFTPPDGTPTAVVRSSAGYCANFTASGFRATCEAQVGVGNAICVPWGAAPLGTADTLAVEFDGQGRVGPLKIAVSAAGGAPPCQIATQACSAQAGLAACIDGLYEGDTCATEPVNAHAGFAGVTALPAFNDFEAICDSSDPTIPCNNTGTDVAFTTDAAGNVVLPIDWRGVLVQGSLPIPRLVQASSSIAAFLAANPTVGPAPQPGQVVGAPLKVPGFGYLQSFSRRGLRVDPIFNPVSSPDSVDTGLFGSADAEFGVIRLLRRSPKFRQCTAGDRAGLPCISYFECPGSECAVGRCQGGASDGLQCTSDAMCPGGECGSSLFNFQDRYSATGQGPVTITSAQYQAEAMNPAAIDGLAATDNLFMFVRSEPLESKDLNLDGDQLDATIITLRDGETGEEFEIGGVVGAVGPASLRVRERSFRFPAVSVEDDVVALLEAEPEEGNSDANGDGDEADAILRVFRLEAGGPVELTAGENRASDPLTVVDQESLVVSDGLVFFRESEAAGTARIQQRSNPQATTTPTAADMTPDGRYVAIGGPGGLSILDRDVNQDGVFDAVATQVVGIGLGSSYPVGLDLSSNGRYLVFDGASVSLPCVNSARRVVALDRDFDEDGIFDEYGDPAAFKYTCRSFPRGGIEGHADPRISADGRWLAYREIAEGSEDSERLQVIDMDPDQNGLWDAWTAQTAPGTTGRLGERITDGPSMSTDGRYLAFVSTGIHLPTDSELPSSPRAPDVYLIDLDHDQNGIVLDNIGDPFDWIRLVTEAADGFLSGLQRVREPTLSGDGRRLAFLARSSLLAPAGLDPKSDLFVWDRDLDEDGLFDEPRAQEMRRVPRSQASRLDPGKPLFDPSPESPPGSTAEPRLTMSPDGRFLGVLAKGTSNLLEMIDLRTDLAFRVLPDPLVGGHGAMLALGPDAQQYMIGANFADPSKLLFGGLDTADLSNDLLGDGDSDDLILTVADARAAIPIPITILGPADAVAVAAGNAAFLRPEAADGIDQNGDLDAGDRVVHVYRNRAAPAVNLGLAAEAVAISDTVIAALVSEAGEGAVLNGDADMDDAVVHVNDVATGTPGSWTSLALAADAVQAVGTRVAFTVPEAGQGASLNGDGDQNDRVLRVYDTATAQLLAFEDEFAVNIPGLAVEDFVLGAQIVAFRVSESGQGLDLNGDGDLVDAVMHTADLSSGRVFPSQQSAIPCPVDACDPRVPYRIVEGKVTFLTLEAHQGGDDLDGDGSGAGLVLQHFNAAAVAVGGTLVDAGDVLGGSLGGLCTTTGNSCASDEDCGGEDCFFPPGACLLDTGNACDPTAANPGCAPGQFCTDETATCQEFQGACLSDGACSGGAVCRDNGDDAERLFSALADQPDGRQRFTSLGRCSDGDGICAADGDCNPSATCDSDQTVLATAADPDLDGMADPIDNCPDVANGDQLDTDADGIGDACDRQTCGNGVQEYEETCDDANQVSADGCSDLCVLEGVTAACGNGLDDDGDGKVDFAGNDKGCTSAADTSERQAGRACDDGIDNDGDYGIDFSAVAPDADDAGCLTQNATSESPQCSDGIDNDNDGLVDWDGAGLGGVDPQCTGPEDSTEKAASGGGCGVGPELMLLVPLLAMLRRRRR